MSKWYIKKMASKGAFSRVKSFRVSWASANVLVVVFFLVLVFSAALSYRMLPSPLNLSDLAFHHGIVRHVFNGNPPWTDAYYPGETQYYPWLVHFFVADFSLLTGIKTSEALLLIGALASAAALSLFRETGRAYGFDDKSLFLVLMLFLSPCLSFGLSGIGSRYTILTLALMIFSLRNHELRGSSGTVFLSGAVLGLSFLVHTLAGVFSVLVVLVFFAGKAIRVQGWRVRLVGAGSGSYIRILALGFIISLVYWMPVFLKYGFPPRVLNPYFVYYREEGGLLDLLFGLKEGGFVNIKAIRSSILLVFFSLAFIKRRVINAPTIFFALFIVGVAGSLHHHVTSAFGFSFYPSRFFQLAQVGLIYGAVLGLAYLTANRKGLTALFVAAICFIVFFNVAEETVGHFRAVAEWFKGVYIEENFRLQADWVEEHTKVNDVFVSNRFDASVMHSLTGRKFVVADPLYSNTYVELDERSRDAVLFFYGNDSILRRDVIEKYNVSYVLLIKPDIYYWTSIKYEKELEDAGVKFEVREYDGYHPQLKATPHLRVTFQDIHPEVGVMFPYLKIFEVEGVNTVILARHNVGDMIQATINVQEK